MIVRHKSIRCHCNTKNKTKIHLMIPRKLLLSLTHGSYLGLGNLITNLMVANAFGFSKEQLLKDVISALLLFAMGVLISLKTMSLKEDVENERRGEK